jgi:AcrR family transcriptional regulator
LNEQSKTRIVLLDDLKSKTKQLRRDHILDEAIRVFDKDGYRGATVHSIAQAAGISDGTIYNVFDNKEDILLAVMERLLCASNPVPESATQVPTDITVEWLLRTLISCRWKDLSPEVLAMMRVVLSEALVNRNFANQYRERFLEPTLALPEPLFQNLVNSGAITNTDVPMALRTIVASFLGFALLKLLDDPVVKERSADIPTQLAEILMNGLKSRGLDDAI